MVSDLMYTYVVGKKSQNLVNVVYERSLISKIFITGWTWVLPIILTMIACGFGVVANFYPKLEMIREPRGPFGRMVDKVYRDVSLFENDMYDVKNDTDTECVPYAGLDDVLNSQGGKHMGNIFTRYHPYIT
jgi:hypothetical protein